MRTLTHALSTQGAFASGDGPEADFSKGIPRMSVIRGKSAHMMCHVQNVGRHKVSTQHTRTSALKGHLLVVGFVDSR